MMSCRPRLFVWLSLALFSCQAGADTICGQDFRPLSISKLKATIKKLESLDQPLPEPQAGDWLSQHVEPGQRFAVYPRQKPNVLTAERNCLYIQPMGTFTETESKLLEDTREYLQAYFQCPVKIQEAIGTEEIPESARRVHPSWGDPQVLTSYVLEKVLAPTLPRDAFARIAFTKEDLWPGEGWNFVFGFAAYRDRVGVWSMYRLGDPEADEASYRNTLRRMVKLATHETGHMFSMRHCTHARCNLQGSNGLEESDRQPLPLCSECHAKTVFATGCDPRVRARQLQELCRRHGFERAAAHYHQVEQLLTSGSRRP